MSRWLLLLVSLALLPVLFSGCRSQQPTAAPAAPAAATVPSPPSTPDVPQSPSDKYRAQQEAEAAKALASVPDSLVVRIARSPCFGRCPWYQLDIYANGYTVYEGRKDVPNIGKFTRKTPVDVIRQIQAEAKRIGYFEFQDIYDNARVTDLPTTITIVRDGKQLKRVLNRYDAPAALSEFERFIDNLFAEADWKPLAVED